ncbi:MAG: metal-dependent hydrolase, partial [Actinobacteria bacterium]|nr:metal-dependent hydrolase [Actinomycetota bacterium]
MLLWHMGLAVAVTYVTLGRRRIDYRYVLLGAVLPDVTDGLLGLFFFSGPAGRWASHSLLSVVVVAVVILLGLSGTTRLAVFGVAVGWLLHLVGDGMWTAPKTFLWPAFGTGFASEPREPYSWDLVADPVAHLSTWGAEALGLAVLVWFAVAFELGRDGRLRLFLSDGYLRP